MMKIKNGKLDFSVSGKMEIEASDDNLLLFGLLNGAVSTENKTIVPGTGIFIPKGKKVGFTAEKEIDYFLLEFSGCENFECNEISDFDFPCFDKLKKFVYWLCPNGTFESIDERFSEGAALMAFSLCGIDNLCCEKSGNLYVDKAKKYIDENYDNDIKIEEIAKKLEIDRKYLRNLFFTQLGMSTKDYLTNLRMKKAMELLEQTTMAVSEVSLKVGYKDALAFSKMFKKHAGVSPTEYRNTPKSTPTDEDLERSAKKEEIKYFLL